MYADILHVWIGHTSVITFLPLKIVFLALVISHCFVAYQVSQKKKKKKKNYHVMASLMDTKFDTVTKK